MAVVTQVKEDNNEVRAHLIDEPHQHINRWNRTNMPNMNNSPQLDISPEDTTGAITFGQAMENLAYIYAQPQYQHQSKAFQTNPVFSIAVNNVPKLAATFIIAARMGGHVGMDDQPDTQLETFVEYLTGSISTRPHQSEKLESLVNQDLQNILQLPQG